MFLRRTAITIFGLLMVSFVHGKPVGDCHRWNPLNQAYHLADDKDCSVFYKCTRSTPVRLACPEGLHFNRWLEVCDRPVSAGCSYWAYKASLVHFTRPSPVVRRPLKQRPELCPAPATCPIYGNGYSITVQVPHPYNCSKFCKCNRGQPVAIDCPRGLHFNRVLEVCDWPDTAGCSVTTVLSEPHPPTPNLCNNSVRYITSDAFKSTPDTSKSDMRISENLSTTLSEIMSGDCPAIGTCPQHEDEQSIVKHLPHANNCSQFCTCQHGVPITFDCPSGLHFNPDTEVCDWPQNSNCSTTISDRLSNIPTTIYATLQANPTNTATTSNTREAVTDVGEDVTPTELTTTELTTIELTTTELTSEGTSTTNNFPTKTIEPFSTETDVTSTVYLESFTSTYATSWTSETTTVITTTDIGDSTVLPQDENACDIILSCPTCNEKSVKHFPHPTNSSLYCTCDHGSAITQICPAGLRFNAKLEVCDWPSNTDCK